MSIRNPRTLEPGKRIIAEELLDKLKGADVYFPLHNVDVDLLVVKGQKHLGVQVMESRYYVGKVLKSGHSGHSLQHLKKIRFQRNKGKVDFYIFLTYLPIQVKRKAKSFGYRFLIVPSSELEKRMAVKNAGKNLTYSFCFHFQDKNIWDEKVTSTLDNPLTEYSKFLNAWDLIGKALNTEGNPHISEQ